MTFTNVNNCDCDECGISEVLPKPISDAVKDHKRKKLLESVANQERELVVREGGVSIWKLAMPPGAEPLTEFGSSHRIILVSQFPEVCVYDTFTLFQRVYHC